MMASREPRVGGGKQRNPNRRVLRDIGNIEGGENNKCKKKEGKSVNKGSKTLTSILIARSKAADIDASDVDDELAAVEYVEDMYNFYKQTEKDGRVVDYMGSQPEITSNMRAILVDWLIQVHNKLRLMPETLYLTINILDRFLALQSVSTTELQLVGISSLLIASKYEKIWAPEVSELIKISSDNTREPVLVMEKAILGKLEWYLTVPTPYVFLIRYIKAAAADKEMENMAFFYAEVGLMSYSTVVHYSPSELSAAAVYAARFTLNRSPFWSQTLQHYTAYSEDRLLECAKSLIGFATEKQQLKAE
ncbi:hypothetical protein ACS0TY_026279 [Phlomoides rotata]